MQILFERQNSELKHIFFKTFWILIALRDSFEKLNNGSDLYLHSAPA